jgi:AcrR family transcriptional regulator
MNGAAVDRRARRMASTRQELLLAGRRLFSEKGLYDSRVEEITEMADIGKGTLYRYFRSKEALVLAVVEEGFAALRRRVSERTATASRLERAIEGVVAAHVEFFSENGDLMRIFHQARGMLTFDRPEWRPLRVSLEAHLEFIAGELARAGGADRLGRARLRDLAMVLFGGVSGAISVRVASRPTGGIGPMVPDLVRALKGMGVAFAAGQNGRAPAGARTRPAAAGRRRA